MKHSPALGCLAAIALLSSLTACQKKPADNAATAPAAQPATPKIVSAEPSSFDAIAKHLNPGGGLYFYLSTESFLKAASEKLSDVVPMLMAMGKMDDAQKAKLQAGWQSLAQFGAKSGISDITGFGASSIALEPGYYQTRWMLHHNESKGGGLIWNIHGSTPNPLDFAAFLPEKTAVASSGNLKLAPIWTALNQESAANADLKQGLDLATQSFQQATGLNLAALLASLGPNYSMVITLDESRMTQIPTGPNGQPISIPEPAMAIFIQVQDDVLINRLDQQLSAIPMVTKSVEGDLQMRSVSMPLLMPFLRPVVAWKKGLLMLSSSDLLLREMLDVKAGRKPGLAASAGFKKLMTGMPTAACKFGYVSPSLQKTINDVQIKSMQNGKATMDPAAQKFIQYVQGLAKTGATLGVVEETAEGWIGTTHGSTGPDKLVAVCAVAPAAILAAVAVPAVVKAQEKAAQLSHPAPQATPQP